MTGHYKRIDTYDVEAMWIYLYPHRCINIGPYDKINGISKASNILVYFLISFSFYLRFVDYMNGWVLFKTQYAVLPYLKTLIGPRNLPPIKLYYVSSILQLKKLSCHDSSHIWKYIHLCFCIYICVHMWVNEEEMPRTTNFVFLTKKIGVKTRTSQ